MKILRDVLNNKFLYYADVEYILCVSGNITGTTNFSSF